MKTFVSILVQSMLIFTLVVLVTACAQVPTNKTVDPTLDLPSSPSTATANPGTSAPVVEERIDLSEGLSLRQIRQDVFIITHVFPWPANSLIVEMANSDLVIVGTPYTPEAMDEVLAWVASQFGVRNIVAINTGYHVDNLGGNRALIEQSVPVYGSDLTAQLLREKGEQTRQLILGMMQGSKSELFYKAHTEIPYLAPSVLFPIEQGLDLSFGDELVKVYYPGPSQAPDKVAVFFPDKKVLFGSCMILGGNQVGNITDADLKNWPEAVSKLKQFDAEIVIPGHGDRLDADLIEHTIAILGGTP